MIIEVSEDGYTITWGRGGERKTASIVQLIEAYDGIVRCKDCFYYVPEVDDPHKSNCQRLWGGMIECNPDSYCSDGVRKNEAEE